MKILNKNINAVVNTIIPVIVIATFLSMLNIISKEEIQGVFFYTLFPALVIMMVLVTREFVI